MAGKIEQAGQTGSLNHSQAALAEDLIPKVTFTQESLISFTPAAKVATLEKFKNPETYLWHRPYLQA
jgi:hypothetical protein